ncbi:hypothetical protein HID58_094329, partial [Brassica napus]
IISYIELTSLLLESTKRCFRKRASAHNSNSWLLPPQLTIKVFSMLGTKSLMQVAACCTHPNKAISAARLHRLRNLDFSARHLATPHVISVAAPRLPPSVAPRQPISLLFSSEGLMVDRLRLFTSSSPFRLFVIRRYRDPL